ncbi:hypothetical protein MUY27_20135 [Mucilaginibacter sp. RS28]|uniref:Uncharacterized protein n=1 Tax=Mucilaginibacter straminoryzae TaxID=2932774 RepID=A0A9X1X6H2_9SPHI|nr:hypothetical protein [Mucilaginibacter straminoryzae]MCJ8212037.1 hypothetical protein [Mucilaginibacter straminoryzae]
MNTKLLKKVEELTLYLLQEHQKNKLQEEQLRKLKQNNQQLLFKFNQIDQKLKSKR